MNNAAGSQPLFTNNIITCEKVQERLIYQRCILHRKWREIQCDEFSIVPIGTLYKIMRTGKVPKKWWRVLKIKAVRQPRIAISKVNMDKAAYSIIKNISYKKVIELTESLIIFVMEQKTP
jgi:hypothetical protein